MFFLDCPSAHAQKAWKPTRCGRKTSTPTVVDDKQPKSSLSIVCNTVDVYEKILINHLYDRLTPWCASGSYRKILRPEQAPWLYPECQLWAIAQAEWC